MRESQPNQLLLSSHTIKNQSFHRLQISRQNIQYPPDDLSSIQQQNQFPKCASQLPLFPPFSFQQVSVLLSVQETAPRMAAPVIWKKMTITLTSWMATGNSKLKTRIISNLLLLKDYSDGAICKNVITVEKFPNLLVPKGKSGCVRCK